MLINKYRNLLNAVPTAFERSLSEKIDWNARAVCITGARGTGKSTLMLQYVKKNLSAAESLYVSLDDLYFRQHTLTETAERFYMLGGRYLFLDEVHKYPGWEQEVKNMYDFHPDLKLAVSGSSILALHRSEADLSRRMLYYLLPELSLREYIALSEGIRLPSFSIETILEDHQNLADQIKGSIPSPLRWYQDYLSYGAYPFFTEGKESYPVRLNQLINVIIDYDLPEARTVEGATLAKLKKLLYIISTSVPFMPNIARLAEQVGTSRNRLLEMLYMLEQAQLVHNLRSAAYGTSLMNKPQKIYLHNVSLIMALAEGMPNMGNLRETFLLSQLKGAGHNISFPKSGDFLIDNRITVEVGGKTKTRKQIRETKNAYLALDGIEYGSPGSIPLWLFGFLY
ncbi:MAG: ATP-binding protein [Mangrovibacterium sp.]